MEPSAKRVASRHLGAGIGEAVGRRLYQRLKNDEHALRAVEVLIAAIGPGPLRESAGRIARGYTGAKAESSPSLGGPENMPYSQWR
jgi:hypothetical protein